MLTHYGRREWLTILVLGLVLVGAFTATEWWWSAVMVVAVTLALLSFFRDPPRRIPADRGLVVSPADGRVSSVHEVEHFEPLGGAAVCVRVFLSVLNVHVNRSPCHGLVTRVEHKAGSHLNALNPESAEVNESNLVVLVNPTHRYPVAAVRQVAGLIARTIVCGVVDDQIVQRGQRTGMIKFGSTTELYLPKALAPQVMVEQGQRVRGGSTVLARVSSPSPGTREGAEPDASRTHGAEAAMVGGH